MKQSSKKASRFPEFVERFRELQGDKSNTQFAADLGISRQTVGFYCNGDRIPDALTIRNIAEVCNVSADWLLGLTDVRAADLNIRSAVDATGLTEDAVEALSNVKKSHDIELLNEVSEILTAGPGCVLIGRLCEFRKMSHQIYIENPYEENKHEYNLLESMEYGATKTLMAYLTYIRHTAAKEPIPSAEVKGEQ